MNLKGKLIANSTLTATTTIPKVINTGGPSTWNEISGKPFSTVDTTGGLTIYDNTLGLDTLDTIATIDYVDQQVSGITESLAAVATTGDYEDLLNKPEIPEPTEVTVTQTLSSGTAIADIDVNGVTTTLYAPQGGGSVDIDNKSIIENQQGQLQTAVPLYGESTTISYGPGLCLDTFTYPAGVDLDANFYSDNFELVADTSDIYRFAIKFDDGTIIDGPWNAITYGGRTYGGDSWEIASGLKEMYIQYEGGSPKEWRLHVYMSGNYIDNGNVVAICLYEAGELPSGATSLENICTEDGLTYSSITTPIYEYHKLPLEYSKIKPNTSGQQYDGSIKLFSLDSNNDYVAKNIALTGLSVSEGIYEDGSRILYIDAPEVPKNYVGGSLNINNYYGINVDETARVGNVMTFYTRTFYELYDSWGGGDYYFTNDYSYYPDEWTSLFSIYGILHLGDITQDPTDISIEGLESVLDSITYDSTNDRWELTWKEGISPRGYMNALAIGNGKQNINAWFIPTDNSTIKVNSDGELYANLSGVTQSDWAQSTTTSLDYIKNKPAIGAGTGIQSIWEGGYTFASGNLSHAEGGDGTTASGRAAHAENSGAVASGMGSHAEGWNTIAASDYQHAQGKGNIEDNSDIYADIIGNGYPDTSVTPTELVRSNAEATDWDGNKYLAGNVYTHVTDWSNPQSNSIKLANIPEPPTTNGTYTLQATVSNGTITYSWI